MSMATNKQNGVNFNMKIQFSTEGAAFKDEYADEVTNNIYTRDEVVRILRGIAANIKYGYDHGPIMDINGNKVGSWEL